MDRLPVYTIQEFQHKSGDKEFYAERLSSHLTVHHHFIQAPHKHNNYLVVLFTGGSGKHEVDFRTYPVKPGSIFLLNPGQMHSWKLSQNTEGIIFFHTREFYELNFLKRKVQDFPFYYSVYNTPLIELTGRELYRTTELLEELLAEYKSRDILKNEKLCSLVDLLYINLSRVYAPAGDSPGSNSGYMKKLRELEDLIDKHYKTEKSPSAYAAMMNISLKHLNRICKECVDRTVSEMITSRVILEAKRMLALPEYSVAQVADATGFFDHSYFTRLFRKTTAETPVQFAQRYRKDHRN